MWSPLVRSPQFPQRSSDGAFGTDAQPQIQRAATGVALPQRTARVVVISPSNASASARRMDVLVPNAITFMASARYGPPRSSHVFRRGAINGQWPATTCAIPSNSGRFAVSSRKAAAASTRSISGRRVSRCATNCVHRARSVGANRANGAKRPRSGAKGPLRGRISAYSRLILCGPGKFNAVHPAGATCAELP